MSNKRKLRLQPYTPPRSTPVIQGMGVIPPEQRDGERCQFPSDCTATARVFIVFSDDTQVTVCADHVEAAAAVLAKHRDQVNAREGN